VCCLPAPRRAGSRGERVLTLRLRSPPQPDWREQLAGTVASLEARCASLEEALELAGCARDAARAQADAARRGARQRQRELSAHAADAVAAAEARGRAAGAASAGTAAARGSPEAQLAAERAEWRTRAAWLEGERDLLAEARSAAAARAEAAEARAAAAEARALQLAAALAAAPPPHAHAHAYADAPCAEAPACEDGREEEAAALRAQLGAERARADAAEGALSLLRTRNAAAAVAAAVAAAGGAEAGATCGGGGGGRELLLRPLLPQRLRAPLVAANR
jgi:colicin import membrane protein